MFNFFKKSFEIKVGTAAAGLAFAVVLFGGVLVYYMTRGQLEATVRNEMDNRAKLIAIHISDDLSNISETLSQMAQNSLFANALADSRGRDKYLRPFLHSFRQVGAIPIHAALSDFRGRILDSNQMQRYAPLDQEILRRVVDTGRPKSQFSDKGDGEIVGALSWPILYANTGLPEGALTFQFLFRSLVEEVFQHRYEDGFRLLVAFPGQSIKADIVQGAPPPAEALFRRTAVPGTENFGDPSLSVEVWQDKALLTKNLNSIALGYIGVAVLAMAIIVPISFFGAQRMLLRLKMLEATALRVVETRSLNRPFPVEGQDEIANLGHAFNHMLSELDIAYEELRHDALREIKVQTARFRRALSASVEGYARVNVGTGTIEEVNEAFCRIIHGRHSECEGIAAPEFLEGIIRRARAEPEQTAWSEKVEFDDPAGTVKLLINSSLDIDEEGNRQLVCFITDISELKRAEESLRKSKETAEEATRTRTEFLANMSHEIRTPMNAILGLTHLVSMTGLTAQQKDYLNKIRVSADSLLGIINDILDFSRIESGRLELEKIDFSLEDTLEQLFNVLAVSAHAKHVELVNYPPSLEIDCLNGDPLRLQQVLTNLLSNAVKFTDRGEVIVKTHVLHKTCDRVVLEFEVRDTGIGIDPEKIPRLFTAFTQADGATTRKYGGTGLGLAISKRLVEMMGGEIRVVAGIGKGSAFYFTAEFGYSDPACKPVSRTAGDDGFEIGVLVVDRSPAVRESVTIMLERLSCTVKSAASMEDALQELGKAPYDLVIADVRLNGLNDLDMVKRMRAIHQGEQLPIIFMITGREPEPYLNKAQRNGVAAFLLKPADTRKLRAAILTVFRKDLDSVRSNQSPDTFELDPALIGARIMLVEDNPINSQVALKMLQFLGFTTIHAESGIKAIELLAETGGISLCDAILMDIQMPDMDGFETTARIRELGFTDLPIIAFTAYAVEGDREKCLNAGMNDYLAKPVHPRQLPATLKKWIPPHDRRVVSSIRAAVRSPGPARHFPDSLPGLQVKSALRRLMDDGGLYKELLETFRRENTGVISELQAALDAGDMRKTSIILHTLKGVAGNLSAEILRGYAEQFEKVISAGLITCMDEAEPYLSRLKKAYAEACDSADAFVRIYGAVVPEPQGSVSQQPLPDDQISPALEKMRHLLLDHSFEADAMAEFLKDALKHTECSEEACVLSEHVGKYDFLGGLEVLNTIKGKLNIR